MEDRDFGYVYEIAHPETGEIVYVGETERTLNNRLGNHIRQALSDEKQKNEGLVQWIVGLVESGKAPIIREIERVPHTNDRIVDKRARWEAEQRWIRRYRDEGKTLFNMSSGISPGHVFAEGTGPRKLKGRIRPVMSGRLTGREQSPEHVAARASSMRQTNAAKRSSGEWDSDDARASRSDAVRKAWEKRRLTPESNDVRQGRASSQTERWRRAAVQRAEAALSSSDSTSEELRRCLRSLEKRQGMEELANKVRTRLAQS